MRVRFAMNLTFPVVPLCRTLSARFLVAGCVPRVPVVPTGEGVAELAELLAG